MKLALSLTRRENAMRKTRSPRRRLSIAAFCMAGLSIPGAAPAQTPGPGAPPLMKAIVYRDYGSPDVLRLEDVAKPVPNDDQVLIRVRAASVNPLDWHYMRGLPYLVRISGAGLLKPKVQRLGVDLAGQVEAVGKNVTRFKPGDEVFGNRFGAFAEYVCATEKALALKPANVTFEQAASLPVAAITALQALRDRGKLQPGQKVLINGASGGVGTFAVQIAKSLGAEVTGVCSTKNVEMVRSIGADRVVDYTKEDFTRSGQRYDLILDMVGNHSLSDCRGVLTSGGIFVIIGSTDKGRWLGPVTGMLKAIVYSKFVSQDMGAMLATMNAKDLGVLRDLVESGKVTPVIDRRYRLSEVPEAIRYLEGGHARGKVVVTLGEGGETSPTRANPAASSGNTIGPVLFLLALVAVLIVVPIVAALALNRRFQRRNPGKRPYRWGYWFSVQSFLGGICLGIMLESGVGSAIAWGVISAVLAWFFARRRRWAWITLTILTFNPVAWIINVFYLRKRWAEDSVAAPAP
jgi:NADPH:quinone reductase-like Zn-dependent oxidoreductase